MSGKHWSPGTQCVTKHDHTKAKGQELAFHKGDVVTIIEAMEGKGWYRARHNETGQEGLLAASALRERGAIRVDPKLSLMPWFHGKISGVEAVQELQPPEDGLFLVRESVRHPGDYVLCVSFCKEVIHYRVVHEENTLSIDSQQYFSNLIDMIEHYMKEQGAICTKLVKPKPKSGMKSAEEELAKAGWLLNLQHLTLGDRIGQGEFGDVLQGEYMGQKVAVKNIKCDVTAQAFLAETAAMTKVRHKNLVCLLGVILHNGLYIVMEFMSKGNLVNFLRTRGRALVPTQQLLLFALDIAQGMDYLESKKLVHRDLAARNILISEENVAKVSDFGLARVNPKGADTTLLPVKWTAPEALKHNKFSSKSDVWSYGILLWEAFSFGRAPYPKLSLKEVTELLEQGYRMEPPEGCPPAVYALMKSCWELEPGKRPSFRKLTEKLQKELKHLRVLALGKHLEVPGTVGHGLLGHPPMATFFTATLKSFRGGDEEPPKGPPKDGKVAMPPNGIGREEFEEYQRQLLEEKIERDKAFVQKKAERATVRMHLRDKYRLAQDERDDAQLHVAGGAVELPQELAAMVHSEEQEEEEEDGAGAFAFLTKMRDVDLPALRDRALGTVDEVKEKCTLM